MGLGALGFNRGPEALEPLGLGGFWGFRGLGFRGLGFRGCRGRRVWGKLLGE